MVLDPMEKKRLARTKRARRVRKDLRGTGSRPRLCVVKSNQHIQAQVIDDETGVTLVGAATYSKGFRGTEFGKRGVEAARKLGEHVAAKAKEKQIERVVFDRGSARYHGTLEAFAAAARDGGLQF